MKNLENIRKILDKIEANPSCWRQDKWHCGSAHCFAGHAQLELTGVEDINTVRRDARIYFGFSLHEANYYFWAKRTLDELKTALLPFYDENGFDRAGYNRDGFNRAGYNRYGYNSDGYDMDGFGGDGYDRDGFDRNNDLKK